MFFGYGCYIYIYITEEKVICYINDGINLKGNDKNILKYVLSYVCFVVYVDWYFKLWL